VIVSTPRQAQNATTVTCRNGGSCDRPHESAQYCCSAAIRSHTVPTPTRRERKIVMNVVALVMLGSIVLYLLQQVENLTS
jgi:hypothetical protein